MSDTFLDDYQKFLLTKAQHSTMSGFKVERNMLHPTLKPHQLDFTEWALYGGRRGLFASFGLGKTRIQLEIVRQIERKFSGKQLIICPLGVKHEFQKEANILGIDLVYVRTQTEVDACRSPFMITNYERIVLGDIDSEQFACVCLDEASVLRTSNSKTHHFFLQRFRNTRFRYVATATPSPNDYIELLYYAEFLGVMSTGEAKTRFFKRNSQKADELEIYPHKEQEFWLWVASWSCFLTKPSDFGHDDEGYELPKLHVHYHLVESDHSSAGHDKRNGQMRLLRESSLSAVDASKEKRDTINVRLKKALEIMGKESDDQNWLLWHHLEDERKAIEKALPEAGTVYGTQRLEDREELLQNFSDGVYRILATKPEIAGSGCNFQKHCSREIFLGINYKFNDIIQALHRVYRFLQKDEVHVHFIYTEAEAHMLEVFKRKWAQHDRLVSNMQAIIAEYGLSGEHVRINKIRSLGVQRLEVSGKRFSSIRNDSVLELYHTPDNSFDMVISSIPFGIMYEYSPSFEDFGNNFTNDDFFKQMEFLIPNLLRKLKPGRIAAIHVKDRILFGNFTGYGFPTCYRFSDHTCEAFERAGFAFMNRITITTDVVRENNQTYRLGWSECCKDATKMGAGLPEYILLFRKPPSDTSNGYADEPVLHEKDFYTRAHWQIDAHGFWKSSGNRLLTREELMKSTHGSIQKWFNSFDAQHIYDYNKHVQVSNMLEEEGRLPYTYMLLAPQSNHSDVWSDIIRIRTLNGSQAHRNLSQHICPMQFDIVNRLIERFTNPDELVADMFAGLGTVGKCAIEKGRRAWLCELNEAYYSDGLGYLRAAEANYNSPTLFDDLLEPEQEKENEHA